MADLVAMLKAADVDPPGLTVEQQLKLWKAVLRREADRQAQARRSRRVAASQPKKAQSATPKAIHAYIAAQPRQRGSIKAAARHFGLSEDTIRRRITA